MPNAPVASYSVSGDTLALLWSTRIPVVFIMVKIARLTCFCLLSSTALLPVQLKTTMLYLESFLVAGNGYSIRLPAPELRVGSKKIT